MIIGSGLLARAFHGEFSQRDDVCIYAAGISNSSCVDPNEFARERKLLAESLRQAESVGTFVYFGTCSVADPEIRTSPYVQHKLEMEQLVQEHLGNLILRLPQVAGRTPNPHTLLNFLYARISRSETFSLWSKAKRNIIDVDDIVLIAKDLIDDRIARNAIWNIANPISYSMPDIVHAMEDVIGKHAIFDVVDYGSEYFIDIEGISSILGKNPAIFDRQYLKRTIDKYYKNAT
jgi:nucleoside-diphosphate-sugar epimerase